MTDEMRIVEVYRSLTHSLSLLEDAESDLEIETRVYVRRALAVCTRLLTKTQKVAMDVPEECDGV